MNDEFITRHYSGTGAILIPSHGIIQLYDLVDENGKSYTVTQDELIQEALSSVNTAEIPLQEGEILTNDKIR